MSFHIWRSEERHGLRYTGFISDGDSKSYKAVTELNLYPEEVVKEECFNHAHKRMASMGTALINLSKQKRLGGHGYGRLTKEKAIKFQYNIEVPSKIILETARHILSTNAMIA